jgi:hypothetical protein
MAVAQKYSEVPKMLNQAGMLQHFLIPTAVNGSPLSVLLRRGFARGGLLEQTGLGVHVKKASLKNSHACQCFASAASLGGL